MSGILITGTSGFIGHALAESMAKDHEVSCISRQPTEVEGVTAIQGDFTSPDDLQKLDPNQIDVVVHLAAVTGGGDRGRTTPGQCHGIIPTRAILCGWGLQKVCARQFDCSGRISVSPVQTVAVADARRTPVSGSDGIRLLKISDGGDSRAI